MTELNRLSQPIVQHVDLEQFPSFCQKKKTKAFKVYRIVLCSVRVLMENKLSL